MSAAQHYPDEHLLELPPDHPHLVSCAECSAALNEIQQLASTLTNELAWSSEPVSEFPHAATVSTLRTIATQMDAEDADAARNVSSLLSLPPAAWLTTLASRPDYRTPGFVRQLIAETDRLIDTRPADVVELTALAVEVADNLEPSWWHGDTVPRLRAAAWRERGYALYYVGRHVEALAAADRAAEHLGRVGVGEYDSARLMLVRALVLRAVERYDEALAVAHQTAATFAAFNDEHRSHYVQLVEAAMAYSVRNYRLALPLLHALVDERSFGDLRTKAVLLQNLAGCYRETMQFDNALKYYGDAVRLFDQLQMPVERARATWHVGRVLLLESKFEDAAPLLRSVKDTYTALGIVDKAALVAIDVAEASLMTGRLADVVELCHFAIAFYRDAQLPYSENALVAISLLREAAEAGRLEPTTISRVRTYLERLPEQPKLLFAYALD
jgi:tetratricopeptide (TPR) repeat protein